MEHIDDKYLIPTDIIDSDNDEVIGFADEAAGDATDPVEVAVRLYYAVRDRIWYDPYEPFYLPEHYRASITIKKRRGFCIPKAALLCAAGRVRGIPTRMGFANVRNHLNTRQLLDYMGGIDVFAYHGFAELFLEGKWIKATPAFNRELCQRHNIASLEFNGREDSIFHSFNNDNKPFMEYLEYLGTYDDVPVDVIVTGWEDVYGKANIRGRIEELERGGGRSSRNFDREDIVRG